VFCPCDVLPQGCFAAPVAIPVGATAFPPQCTSCTAATRGPGAKIGAFEPGHRPPANYLAEPSMAERKICGFGIWLHTKFVAERPIWAGGAEEKSP
jgi:hypothetical protein